MMKHTHLTHDDIVIVTCALVHDQMSGVNKWMKHFTQGLLALASLLTLPNFIFCEVSPHSPGMNSCVVVIQPWMGVDNTNIDTLSHLGLFTSPTLGCDCTGSGHDPVCFPPPLEALHSKNSIPISGVKGGPELCNLYQ